MANPSNIYAEKIYAEHPNSLFALDEQADFVPYLTLANSDINTWSYTNSTKTSFVNTTAPYGPILSGYSTKITANTSTTQIVITSPVNSFVSSTDHFTIGFYLYSNNSSISSVIVSYIQDTTETSSPVTITTTTVNSWKYISANFMSTVNNTGNGGRVLIKINYSTPNISSYDFIINGLSIGYKTEEHQKISTGTYPITIPTTISTNQTSAIPAYSYATQSSNGYYIVDTSNKMLLAKNTSMPMVYGSGNCTVLYPHSQSNNPSLIVSGNGFMNEVNKNTNITLECWLKINNVSATSPQRILGPVNSTDGLYVNGPFLSLKIGTILESFYVAEWYRPMLVDISISPTSAYVLINGKQVIYTSYPNGTLSFLSKYASDGKDQDYIGFYASSNVPSIAVDCIAFYPYLVNESMALRRYVYGQGVEFSKSLDSSYSGQTTFIDYSFAGYTNNYNYPELGKWQSGFQDNLSTFTNYIEPAQATSEILPVVKLGNTSYTLDNLTTDIYAMNYNSADSNGSYINLLPSGIGVSRTWTNSTNYLLFDSISKISNDIHAIYGVFKSPSSASSIDNVLIKIQNQDNGDYIAVYLNGTTLKYRAKINSTSEVNILSSDQTVSTSTAFTVALNFDTLQKSSVADFQNFFNNKNKLVIYVGGDYSGTDTAQSTTFTGNIYTFGILNTKTLSALSTYFDSATGVAATTLSIDLLSKYPTYGLFFNILLSYGYFDIKTTASWQDYIPIPLLSKYVSNSTGTTSYDLDYVQLNIDYPELNIFSSGNYDTSSSMLKSYVTFQYLSDGASAGSSAYTSTVAISQNKVISPSGNDWKTKKYEFVNNAIVYMPTVSDSGQTIQNLAIVLHLEINVNGVIKNPLKIKSLQVSPKALNSNVTGNYTLQNGIGTRFGTTLYPTTVTSGNKFFDSINPFIIGKETSQYLNLTNTSGIKLAGSIDSTDRSLYMKLNPNLSTYFQISTIQMSLLWNEPSFPTTAQKVVEITDALKTIRFYVVSISSGNTSRGKIYAKQTTDGVTETDFVDLTYYLNGISVNQPYLNIKEWAMLGISFNKLLFLDGVAGEFKLMSNMLVNNISYYQLSEYKKSIQLASRTWNGIVSSGAWSVWNTGGASAGPWSSLMVPSSTTYIPSISPDKLYQVFTGTNKSIFDSDPASGKIRSHLYQYKVYQNNIMSSQILRPQ